MTDTQPASQLASDVAVANTALSLVRRAGKKRSERRKHWALPRPMQAGSVLHLCTKYEADRSIRSKVIKRVPTFGN